VVCDADGSIRALERVLRASDQIGGRGILLHAASPAARALQLPMGLEPSPLAPSTLIAGLSDLLEALRS
jgi:hypothetical protein